MIEVPFIVDSPPHLSAVIRLTVPRAEIASAMDPAVAEVMAVVAAQGATVAGALFTRHFSVTPDKFDFEVGFPVTGPIVAEGRVEQGELPSARVARTLYRGPYERLGDAWTELRAWIAAQGYEQGTQLWERYLVGPESSPDPSEWRTELNRVILGAGAASGHI